MNKNIDVYVNRTPNKKYGCVYNKHKLEDSENIKILEELAIDNENTFENNENYKIIQNIDIELDYNLNSNSRYKENNYECNSCCENEIYEDLNRLHQKYTGQIYKSRKIILNPPKKDVIVSVTNINRHININDIEVLENGINVNLEIIVSLNYGTSKDILTKYEKFKEDKKREIVILEKDKDPLILTDGVVRNATVIIPCNIYICIPENKPCSKYKVANKCLKVSDTQYILDDESVVCGGIPIGNSLKGIMENYIVSIEVESI